MSITFKKLEMLLSSNGKTFYSLRKDKIVGTETIKKLQQDYGIIDTRTISNLCEYLNCQPGDLMEYIPDNQSSGLSPKATPSAPATRHPEPESHEREAFPRPTAPDHGHIEDKTESSAPSCESPAEKLEQLRRKTMEAMAAQRNNSEYGSGDNSHIRIKQAEEPDTYRETFEEKMARLSKSHPLKTDGVVQRQ